MFSYLDAATGSMIVSAIAGGAAGLSVAGRAGLRRFKEKVGRTNESAESQNQPGESTEQPASA